MEDKMGTEETPKRVVLAGQGLRKSYGPVEVLHGVDFDIRAGEVHALLGENGAGKSTLVKMLSGLVAPSAGELLVDGAPVQFASVRAAEDAGIVLIHQEFNLAELRTVEENIFLGRERKRGPFLDKSAMRAEARNLLDQLNCGAPATAQVASLAVADKQMVEIAKAMSRKARVLFLDEPTAVLTKAETASLFALVERLKAEGVGIVFISHKLDEVEQIADRITVLRDGTHVTTVPAAGVTPDEMARMMVGRELSDFYPDLGTPQDEVLLSVQDFAAPGVTHASFDLRKGEVIGFAGLQGAGRTALMEALIGLAPIQSGQVRFDGAAATYADVAQAKAAGIAYLTKDRKGKGLLLGNDLVWNFSLFSLEKFARPFLNRKAERAAYNTRTKAVDLRAASARLNAGSLSGGNQQKLLLAKVLEADPQVIIIDEPTRGIDVGAKAQIYGFIADLAAQGRGVIVLSSELPEIIGLSHRVVVMHDGHVAGCLSGTDINEETIMRFASGLASDRAA
ncbi:sugar ABC transporter ATP-binding protein [Cognatiyoonia sp. IB215182]|uniref:sugar ABC transporter ATP-binding protein n=1 Tax=Cognatiyoonia sp. IB215182 TaxID=3097353 RepID=UPI002A170F98|nr:sugar ABC transporter ATP-binding protein [Cognatiyoonia sp. IB215182]MDX8354508.1 sugar ABC transporter ATP-binding protein [Cognatiyoonia sp. IB215182]